MARSWLRGDYDRQRQAVRRERLHGGQPDAPVWPTLIVTYQGRSVVVWVNDSGPFSDPVLDLSQAAAKYIGLTTTDTVDVMNADPSTPTGPYSGDVTTSPDREEPASAKTQKPQRVVGKAQPPM